MLLELCVTELEDVATDRVCGRLPQPVVQESPHPYMDDASLSGTVKIPGKLRLNGQENSVNQVLIVAFLPLFYICNVFTYVMHCITRCIGKFLHELSKKHGGFAFNSC